MMILKYIVMANLIKSTLREAYKIKKKELIKNQRQDLKKGLEQQLRKLFGLLKDKKSCQISLIGSYLADEERQIHPPQLSGFSFAFPRFQKRLIEKGQVPLMDFKIVMSPEALKQKVFGILVPPKDLPTVYPKVFLVPLTCFHPVSLHRIGHGGGYYDRFIENMRKKQGDQIFIGIGAEILKTTEQFWTRSDQALDFVITESSIY